MGVKELELLHAVVPSATVIALLVNPTDPIIVQTLSKSLQTAARAIQRELLVVSASTEREIDTAFTTLVQRKVGALVVTIRSSTHVLSTRRAGSTPCAACDLSVPRICRGWWPDELWKQPRR